MAKNVCVMIQLKEDTNTSKEHTVDQKILKVNYFRSKVHHFLPLRFVPKSLFLLCMAVVSKMP